MLKWDASCIGSIFKLSNNSKTIEKIEQTGSYRNMYGDRVLSAEGIYKWTIQINKIVN